MSDTYVYLLLGGGVLVAVATAAALLAVGYLAGRAALHDAVAEIRELKCSLAAAIAVIEAAEEAGFVQSDSPSGRHRAEVPDV